MQLFCPNLIAFKCGSSEFLISNYIFCLALAEDEDYLESNLMHGINGYLYANLPDLEVCLGEKVSWHLIGLGNEVDMHTAYFYGNTFSENGQMKDTVSLLPGNEAERKKESDARLLSFSLIFCSGDGKRWNQTVINRCLLVKLVSICNLGAFSICLVLTSLHLDVSRFLCYTPPTPPRSLFFFTNPRWTNFFYSAENFGNNQQQLEWNKLKKELISTNFKILFSA